MSEQYSRPIGRSFVLLTKVVVLMSSVAGCGGSLTDASHREYGVARDVYGEPVLAKKPTAVNTPSPQYAETNK